MPCPFGYQGGEGEEELDEIDEDFDVDSDGVAGDGEDEGEGKRLPKKSEKKKSTAKDGGVKACPMCCTTHGRMCQVVVDGPAAGGGARFDFEKDPVSWFYQHQIRSEEEYQEKKQRRREDSKRRLEAIMAKKHKRIEYANSDLGSLASSELSELDSDLHSIGSLNSCADSWMEDAEYKSPAEGNLHWMLPTAVAVSGFTLYQVYTADLILRDVEETVLNEKSPYYAAAVAALLILTALVLYLAKRCRSKRLLFGGLIGLGCTYAAAAAISAILTFHPTQADESPSCRKMGHPILGASQECSRSPAAMELHDAMDLVLWCCLAVGGAALVLGAICSWYVFELCYLEKKAVKHNRRHRKRKHSIPWKKIKVVGPVMNCGQGSMTGGGGSCPMGAGAGGGGGGGKCPMSFGGKK